MQKLKITYKKSGTAVYIGHLELAQVFERALRRTSLPIKYSEGFNPRMRLSWGPPLPLGVIGLAEEMLIEMDGWVNPARVRQELPDKFPEGIEILKVEIGNPRADSLDSSAQASEYTLELSESDAAKLATELPAILQQATLLIDKKSKAGIKKTNIRPMIFSAEIAGGNLKAVLQTSNHGTLRPRELCEILKISPLKIVREKVLSRN